MPWLVEKRLPLWNRERVLAVVIIVLSLIIVFIALDEAASRRPHIMLQGALEAMQESDKLLSMHITEQGEGYTLSFNGRMHGEQTLSGELLEYKLHVYKNQYGELYVRDLIGEDWKSAASLKLDKLKDFLVTPFAVLEQNQERFTKAVFVDGGKKGEHVIKLSLDPASFIPSLDLAMKEGCLLECHMFIQDETLFMSKISFLLHDQATQTLLLNRTLTFQ